LCEISWTMREKICPPGRVFVYGGLNGTWDVHGTQVTKGMLCKFVIIRFCTKIWIKYYYFFGFYGGWPIQCSAVTTILFVLHFQTKLHPSSGCQLIIAAGKHWRHLCMQRTILSNQRRWQRLYLRLQNRKRNRKIRFILGPFFHKNALYEAQDKAEALFDFVLGQALLQLHPLQQLKYQQRRNQHRQLHSLFCTIYWHLFCFVGSTCTEIVWTCTWVRFQRKWNVCKINTITTIDHVFLEKMFVGSLRNDVFVLIPFCNSAVFRAVRCLNIPKLNLTHSENVHMSCTHCIKVPSTT
jgi:hypothetical protein